MMTECLYPKVALLDPELTMSVPKDQTAYGVCDLITHVTEGYFNSTGNTPIQDRFAEGVILTAMEYGPKAIADSTDLDARTQVQWAERFDRMGPIRAGSMGSPVHMIEHTVSAYHDITHAAGLSIINPSWMRFAAKTNTSKFVQFAERIFGLPAKGPRHGMRPVRHRPVRGVPQVDRLPDPLLRGSGIDEKLIGTYARRRSASCTMTKGCFLQDRP